MATRRELLDAYNAVSSRLVRGAGAQMSLAFQNLGSWRDADFERWLPFATATMTGAQLQAARLQIAFYKQIAEQSGERFVAPPVNPADYSTQALRNGATEAEVYRRPFVELYTNLDKGKTLTESVKAAAERISSIASTNIQLARRNAGQIARNGNGRIVGYARTLTGAENCALCYIASTQRYTRGELAPIHPGCDCGEMPIWGNQDPGQVIDEARLNATHDAIEATFGNTDFGARDLGFGKTFRTPDGDIKQGDFTLIKIREHGELGPVLTVADQNFTGPSDF